MQKHANKQQYKFVTSILIYNKTKMLHFVLLKRFFCIQSLSYVYSNTTYVAPKNIPYIYMKTILYFDDANISIILGSLFQF